MKVVTMWHLKTINSQGGTIPIVLLMYNEQKKRKKTRNKVAV